MAYPAHLASSYLVQEFHLGQPPESLAKSGVNTQATPPPDPEPDRPPPRLQNEWMGE